MLFGGDPPIEGPQAHRAAQDLAQQGGDLDHPAGPR
jgi:hypothetical protein